MDSEDGKDELSGITIWMGAAHSLNTTSPA